MPTSSPTSLKENPPDSMKEAIPDMTEPSTTETPPPLTDPEPHNTASGRHNQPANTPADPTTKTGRTQEPASDTLQQHRPAPAGKAAPARLSISTNSAIGLIGVLVTIFGSAIIGLMLHTLNSLTDRITTVETGIAAVETNLNNRMDAIETNLNYRITALSQQQADMDNTLSVLVAILNARSEVEAAKAHRITSPE